MFLALAVTLACIHTIRAMDLNDAIKKNDCIVIKNIIENAEKKGTLQDILDKLETSNVILSSPLCYGIFKKTADQHFDNIYESMQQDFATLTFFQYVSYNKTIINYLLTHSEIELSLEDLNWHSSKLALLRMEQLSPYPSDKPSYDYCTRQKVLQKILDPKRISRTMINILKVFKKNMRPYYRYLWFKDHIFQPTNYEDFNGFRKTEWLEMIPRLLLVPNEFPYDRIECCDYDIKFYYNNHN